MSGGTYKLCKDCAHFRSADEDRNPRCQRPIDSLVWGERNLNRQAWVERGEVKTLLGRASDGSECGKEAQFFEAISVIK